MRDAIQRYVDAAQSLTEIPRARAEKIAKRLAGNGMIDRDQIRSVASDLVSRSRENSRRITQLVTNEIGRQIARLGLASADDVERLGQRVQAVEIALKDRRRAGAVPTRTATAPKTAKPVAASRVTARRTPTKRATARRPAAKRPATRPVARPVTRPSARRRPRR